MKDAVVPTARTLGKSKYERRAQRRASNVDLQRLPPGMTPDAFPDLAVLNLVGTSVLMPMARCSHCGEPMIHECFPDINLILLIFVFRKFSVLLPLFSVLFSFVLSGITTSD